MIRRARLSDVSALTRLESSFPSDRLSAQRFRYLLTRAHADVWVYADKEQVVGNVVVLYRTGSRRARLYSLVVDPTARGRGIAQRLLDIVEDAARKKPCDTITLEVRPRNAAARRLYEKRGYEVISKITSFYDDGADAWRFGCTLTQRR